MNKIKVTVHHYVTSVRWEMEHPNEEPIKEEIIGECGTNYEPGNIDSANTAIDSIISEIIEEDETFRREAKRFGFECESGTIELIITREDDSIISSLTIDNKKELELFRMVYEFLKKNFYYI